MQNHPISNRTPSALEVEDALPNHPISNRTPSAFDYFIGAKEGFFASLRPQS
jgi:hypothetical protein